MHDQKLAGMIDHTILKPEATKEDVKKVCDEAKKYSFATVCVRPENVSFVAEQLKGTSVLPISVIDFPKGLGTTDEKIKEAKKAVCDGAKEIDMVLHVPALKKKDYFYVLRDIQGVVEASRPYPVKVILETGALTREEKIISSALSKAAGAAFVKTSTGFGPGGATAEDIALMRSVVGPEMGVKASGGIRTREDALKMVAAGASRIGASASIAIVTGEQATSPQKY